MDDKEIVKLWGSIGGEIHIKEAIRLYRMAEANTGLEYEKMLLKQDINCNQLLKQARASALRCQFCTEPKGEMHVICEQCFNIHDAGLKTDEQETCNRQHEAVVRDLLIQGKAHAEQQYTEGYLAGQRSKTAYELGKGDGMKAIMDTCEKCRRVQYGRGQADRIAELKRIMKLHGSWKAIEEFVEENSSTRKTTTTKKKED